MCEAVEARKRLISDLSRACGLDPDDLPNTGSEDDLLNAWCHLEGVVAEFTDGGDEMAEGCTCSEPAHKSGRYKGALTFKDVYHNWRISNGMRA
jgi:hypothetical protein